MADTTKSDAPARTAGEVPRRAGKPFATALRILLKTLLPIAILGGAVAAYAKLKDTRPDPPKREQSEKVWPVRAVPVAFKDFQPELRLYGETVAGRRVAIRSLVSGEVVEVGGGLSEGGIVEAGETLIRVDAFDYEGALVEARANLQEAEARLVELNASLAQERDTLEHERETLKLAERDLQRAKPLAKRGTVSQKTVDDRQLLVTQRTQAVQQRENALKVWQAKIAQQKASIARLEWGVRRAERRLDETRLQAPFDAYVTEVDAELGRMLSANDPVAMLYDRDWIEVKFTLSDRQYGRLLEQSRTIEGREVEVLWHIGEEPLRYPAVIKRTAARITSSSGGVTLYARLRDPLSPAPIRPGAFVEVVMPDREYMQVARLPQTTVYHGNTLYVIEDGRLEPRKVQVVGAADNNVLVRGELKPGDRVIRTRLSAPAKGLKVEER